MTASSLPASLPAQPSRGKTPAKGSLVNADTLQSLRNAFKLGISLILTWAVALAARLVLPRHLGPATFGAFQFADAITATVFVLTGFGLDTYIRKEVSTKRDHASDFLGGVLLVRVVLSAAVATALVVALAYAGKAYAVQRLVLVLSLAQLFVITNATYGAVLHSVGVVGALSVLNVASKLLWGAGIALAIWLNLGVEAIAWALVASEAFETVALMVITTRAVGVRTVINVPGTTAVLAASLPFFLGDVARTALGKVDVSVLSFLTTDLEVGWYAAASNMAGLTMLITPLIGWVFLPLSARAAARSDEELTALTRRSMELILALAIPVTLLLSLGAEDVVRLVYGPAFAPAARSLEILAPMFVITYVAIVSGMTLYRLDRGWTVTKVMIGGLLASPVLNWMLVPWFAVHLGRGGAGVGAAVVLVLLETAMTIVMTCLIWQRAFDRRTGVAMARTAIVCVVVVAVDRALASVGGARLMVDVVVYAGLAVALRAVDVREIVQFVRRAAAQRGESHAGVS